MKRRIDVFLVKCLPGGYLSPNRGERKAGRVPQIISEQKRALRGEVCLGLLAEDQVRALDRPLDPVHLVLTLRVRSASAAADGRFYRPTDYGNACYALKAAIDGIKDAGVIVDDDWKHVPLGTTAVERVATAIEEGLAITVIELQVEPMEEQ